jgi:aryl carrier-like protein
MPDHIATLDLEVRFLFQNSLNVGEMLFHILSESRANITQSLSLLGYGIDSWGIMVWFPTWSKRFLQLHITQTGSGDIPSPCLLDNGSSFPGGKSTGAWSWPFPSSGCQSEEWVELCLHSSRLPLWRGDVQLYLLFDAYLAVYVAVKELCFLQGYRCTVRVVTN